MNKQGFLPQFFPPATQAAPPRPSPLQRTVPPPPSDPSPGSSPWPQGLRMRLRPIGLRSQKRPRRQGLASRAGGRQLRASGSKAPWSRARMSSHSAWPSTRARQPLHTRRQRPSSVRGGTWLSTTRRSSGGSWLRSSACSGSGSGAGTGAGRPLEAQVPMGPQPGRAATAGEGSSVWDSQLPRPRPCRPHPQTASFNPPTAQPRRPLSLSPNSSWPSAQLSPSPAACTGTCSAARRPESHLGSYQFSPSPLPAPPLRPVTRPPLPQNSQPPPSARPSLPTASPLRPAQCPLRPARPSRPPAILTRSPPSCCIRAAE